MSQSSNSSKAPDASGSPESEFGSSLALPDSTINNGASSGSSSPSIDEEASNFAFLAHEPNEREHGGTAKSNANGETTLTEIQTTRTCTAANGDKVGSSHPTIALSANSVSSAKLCTQEEFDMSQGALYEHYGLHLKKVTIYYNQY